MASRHPSNGEQNMNKLMQLLRSTLLVLMRATDISGNSGQKSVTVTQYP
jgi:hypothetical protein